MAKLKKNLFIEDWLVKMMDVEALQAGGQGELASAAIYNFCTAPKEHKAQMLLDYRKKEVSMSYNETLAGDPRAVVERVGVPKGAGERKKGRRNHAG